MRIRYSVPAIAALLVAGAASAAAVRGAVEEAEAAVYEAQGYPVCLEVNPLVGRGGVVNADAIEECHCALDRLTAERGASGLPRLDEGNARTVLGPYLAQCRGGAAGGDKVPEAAAPPVAAPDGTAAGDKPIFDEGGAASEAAADEAADGSAEQAATGTGEGATRQVSSWLAWTGLPGWALWLFPIVAALAALVVFLTRRRGGRGDLIGPPGSVGRDKGVGPRTRE